MGIKRMNDQHISYVIDLVFICLFIASELIGLSKADATGVTELLVKPITAILRSRSNSPSSRPNIV